MDDAGWSDTAQTTYVFDTEGSKTLYAWAKDAAGNISNSASDSVEVTIGLIPTEGLVSYWSFDGNALDNYGSNNGTVVGATLTTGVSGDASTAYGFDGVNDYITSSAPGGLTSATISVWVKLNSLSPESQYNLFAYTFGGQGAGSHDKDLSVDSTGKAFFYIWDGGGKAAISTTTLSTGIWYHIVGVTNGSATKIYINSVLENSVNSGASYGGGNSFVMSFIKVSDGWGRYLNGTLDKVRVYNRALTAGEVLALYAQETP